MVEQKVLQYGSKFCNLLMYVAILYLNFLPHKYCIDATAWVLHRGLVAALV